jgi:endonuclease YncB( thermonuclease family)
MTTRLACLLPGIRMVLCALLAMIDPTTMRAEDAAVWTQKPVHIDRAKQHFERLPPLPQQIDDRTWLVVPFRIQIIDSVRFAIGDKTYRIGHVRPVARARMCRDREAGRWSCGRMGAILLGNLVSGKRLLCHAATIGTETVLNQCQSTTRDIASQIVASGFGAAEDDAALKGAEQSARAGRLGVWRNPDCNGDFDRC